MLFTVNCLVSSAASFELLQQQLDVFCGANQNMWAQQYVCLNPIRKHKFGLINCLRILYKQLITKFFYIVITPCLILKLAYINYDNHKYWRLVFIFQRKLINQHFQCFKLSLHFGKSINCNISLYYDIIILRFPN